MKEYRKSIRLKGYDYSISGFYFITICCDKRKYLFGKIINGKMELNDIGKMAQKCWIEIPDHFTNVVLHEFVIMPNHVHGIIESPSKTIGSVVRGFKIGVTKLVRQNTFVTDVWQRNYYEHIIRDEKSFQRISEYIINNPVKWENDKFYK